MKFDQTKSRVDGSWQDLSLNSTRLYDDDESSWELTTDDASRNESESFMQEFSSIVRYRALSI